MDLLVTPSECYGAFSYSRKMRAAYGGSFYTLSGSRVTDLFDQSSSGMCDMVQPTVGPVLATAGPLNRRCGHHTAASTQYLYQERKDTSADGRFVDWFGATANYAIVTCIIDSFTTDFADIWDNAGIWADEGDLCGLLIKATGTSVTAYAWQTGGGGARVATATGLATGRVYVIEWVSGSNMEVSVNGVITVGDSYATGSGVTDQIQYFATSFTSYFSGKIFEFLCTDYVPTATERARLRHNMGTWVGANVVG